MVEVSKRSLAGMVESCEESRSPLNSSFSREVDLSFGGVLYVLRSFLLCENESKENVDSFGKIGYFKGKVEKHRDIEEARPSRRHRCFEVTPCSRFDRLTL